MNTRYQPNGVELTPRERELLTVLIEECAEVIHTATKLLRFGYGDCPPGRTANHIALSREIGDLKAMIFIAMGSRLLDDATVIEGFHRKYERLEKYSEHLP